MHYLVHYIVHYTGHYTVSCSQMLCLRNKPKCTACLERFARYATFVCLALAVVVAASAAPVESGLSWHLICPSELALDLPSGLAPDLPSELAPDLPSELALDVPSELALDWSLG